MLTALIVGLVASSALIIGAIIGAYWRPPNILLAIALAFASGALIVAVAFELFEEAYQIAGITIAGGGLILGAAAFVIATALLDRYSSRTGGFYLLASISLDGVPENLALGIGLINKSWTAIAALLLAIFFSNLPESMGGAAGMRDENRSKRSIIAIWTATAMILTAMVVLGRTIFLGLNETGLAGMRSFAAGAVLASLADALMPQAYREGGKMVAFATALGFLLTFVVTQ